MEKAAETDQAAGKITNSNKTINDVRKMDWLKSIISVVVGIAAVLIIWRVGFVPEPPIAGQAEKPTEAKVVADTLLRCADFLAQHKEGTGASSFPPILHNVALAHVIM